MKKWCLGIVVGLIIVVVGAWGIRKGIEDKDMPVESDSQSTEIQQQMQNDILTGNTKIEQVIIEEIDITVEVISEEKLQVYVEAPNISEALINWVETSDEDIEEAKLEEKIIELIQKEVSISEAYELTYEKHDMYINYTEDYINAVTCGLYEFYDYAMNQVVLEMLEEDANEKE